MRYREYFIEPRHGRLNDCRDREEGEGDEEIECYTECYGEDKDRKSYIFRGLVDRGMAFHDRVHESLVLAGCDCARDLAVLSRRGARIRPLILSIIMSNEEQKPPRIEEFRVSGEEVLAKIKELIKAGNVRRIILKN